MIIKVNDKMQNGYSYILIEKEGQNLAPDFKPELTPKEMLELGVFEGHYLTDCQKEFPQGARSYGTGELRQGQARGGGG